MSSYDATPTPLPIKADQEPLVKRDLAKNVWSFRFRHYTKCLGSQNQALRSGILRNAFIKTFGVFLPHSPVGYSFHPWCPDGRAGGGKKFVRAVSQKP